MRFLKWVLGTLLVLLLITGGGVAALVYLVDWNDFRATIQNQVKKQTGRDLQISGDLSPSVFPWVGISIGEIALANAQGFGDVPFASIDSADVKVELLPLIKRTINVRYVELKGLQLDLQRAADGTTNWDDLVEPTTTTTMSGGDADEQVTIEVEGSSATIAALSVGGIQVLNANVSWRDFSSATDAKLSAFNLRTDAIELEKPFVMDVEFSLASDSLDLAADVDIKGELMIDLDSQIYTVNGFTLTTEARGSVLPDGQQSAALAADLKVKLAEHHVSVSNLSLQALGLELNGRVDLEKLDTEPAVSGQFASNTFNPRELLEQLGIDSPQTADETTLGKASLQLRLAATANRLLLSDLQLMLDDTTVTGSAELPEMSATVLPLRFDLAADALDLDRYLAPASETDAKSSGEGEATTDQNAVGDLPIVLPTDLLRQIDIAGRIHIDSLKARHLHARDIVIPVKAHAGRLSLEELQANLYEGGLAGRASIDVTADAPAYAVQLSLSGIQAAPLLADLMQREAFLSGQADVSVDLRTQGEWLSQLKTALAGSFETSITDGAIIGINIAQQIRRARAALSAQRLPSETDAKKTDFTSLLVSGSVDQGVISSDDLDMRSPLLRLGGQGSVDLPAEWMDYTLMALITGTTQGQGGAELESLDGMRLAVPIRGSFDALATDFTAVILSGLKDTITGNLKDQVKTMADERAVEIEAQVRDLQIKKEAELKERVDELKSEAREKVQEGLERLFK